MKMISIVITRLCFQEKKCFELGSFDTLIYQIFFIKEDTKA